MAYDGFVEQELPTIPEHLSSPPGFSGVRVTRSLVLYVCFVDRSLSFSTFSFVHCVVCSSSRYGFWLPLWYLLAMVLSVLRLLITPLLSFGHGVVCPSSSDYPRSFKRSPDLNDHFFFVPKLTDFLIQVWL